MEIECRPSLLANGDESIAWIAANLRIEALNPFVAKFSQLGEAGLIMLMLALSYWFWNKRHAALLTYGMLAALIVNLVLKDWIMECRPPQELWLDQIRPGSFSFPSGHAQVCILLWVGLAYFVRSRWLSMTCILIGLLIALSRPYLGVHYLHDIVAGMLIGISILGTCLLLDKNQFLKKLTNSNRYTWFFPLFFFILCPFLIHPLNKSLIAGGFGLGFWLGRQLEQKYLSFAPPKKVSVLSLQCVIGTLFLFLLWKGMALLGLSLPWYGEFLQCSVIGFFIAFGAPWLFTRQIIGQVQWRIN